MTIDSTGKTLCCDGDRCEAKTAAPVSRNSALSARGWLFIVNGKTRLHYCPECAARIQRQVADSSHRVSTQKPPAQKATA